MRVFYKDIANFEQLREDAALCGVELDKAKEPHNLPCLTQDDDQLTVTLSQGFVFHLKYDTYEQAIRTIQISLGEFADVVDIIGGVTSEASSSDTDAFVSDIDDGTSRITGQDSCGEVSMEWFDNQRRLIFG